MSNPDNYFQKGNKAAKKSPKPMLRKFNEMLIEAQKNEDILCWFDACKAVNLRNTKGDYWAEKVFVLGKLKKEIQNTIISRINKNALIGERAGGFAGTASIWRMKQLGEKDQQHKDITTQGEKIDNPFLALMQQSTSDDNTASH